MSDVTIFENKERQYVLPQACCACGSSRVSAKRQFSHSWASSTASGTVSLALPVCPRHAENPTEISLSGINLSRLLKGYPSRQVNGLRFSHLNSSYAQALLLSNLQLAVQIAKADSSYENLATLVAYYITNREGEPWIITMFNKLGVGEIIAQGLESGLLEEQIKDVDAALDFETALVGLKGIEKGIELANRLLPKFGKHAHGYVYARDFLGGQRRFFPDHQAEIVSFWNQVLRDNSLTYFAQTAAVTPLVACDLAQLVKAMRDEDINVKVRFDIIDKLRKEELPIEDPDFIEKFYVEIKDNKEMPMRMRIGAAVALGDPKAILIQSINTPASYAAAAALLGFCGAFLILYLIMGEDIGLGFLCSRALLISLGLFVPVFIISFPSSRRAQLQDVKWYQKRRGDLGENQ